MLDPRQRVGKDGESRAEEYLRRRGYRILQRNLKSSSGELDLIAEDRGVLVFVEVKARQTEACGGVRYTVDSRKQAVLCGKRHSTWLAIESVTVPVGSTSCLSPERSHGMDPLSSFRMLFRQARPIFTVDGTTAVRMSCRIWDI